MNEIPIKTVISENIKLLRKKLGWSQEFLAEKTGVSALYITQIEVGKRAPSLDIIEKLATALQVEYKLLFEPQDAAKDAALNEFSKYILESRLISSTGLEALKNALGVVGATRFLQQYDTGYGDYTKEKYSFEEENAEDIYTQLKKY
ncbi:MAG: helix-turn-helix domain-containing protein [Treponemataceae bacterium]|nr:helix-turn-helix domain-containing protein [Treponemataceae bacterium]